MTEQDAQSVVLTPEQQRRLGHVYRIILGWRREHITSTEKLPHDETAPSQSGQSSSNAARPSESEA